MFLPEGPPTNVPNCLFCAAATGGMPIQGSPLHLSLTMRSTVGEMPPSCEAMSNTVTFLSRTPNVSKKRNSQSDARDFHQGTLLRTFRGCIFLLLLGRDLVGVLFGLFVCCLVFVVCWFFKYHLKLTYLDKYWNSLHIFAFDLVLMPSHKSINTCPRTRRNDSKALVESIFYYRDSSYLPGYKVDFWGSNTYLHCHRKVCLCLRWEKYINSFLNKWLIASSWLTYFNYV